MKARKDRFSGEILGVGTTARMRVVVGNWTVSPYGPFADVMVERADGHRILLAPTQQIAEYVASTYSFDEVREVAVEVERCGDRLSAVARPLQLRVRLGRRTPIGWALHLLPDAVTAQTWFCKLGDPFARVLLPGVRTHGSAGQGRYEYYGAHDVRAVASLTASWDGHPLGDLTPVTPTPRFGFSSTPRRPTLTRVTTTILRPQ